MSKKYVPRIAAGAFKGWRPARKIHSHGLKMLTRFPDKKDIPTLTGVIKSRTSQVVTNSFVLENRNE